MTITTDITDGIERITYTPARRKYDTPILLQHGMWHGAWCWQQWQQILADLGWESHAISLPGHGGSDPARVRFATMGRYLDVLRAQVDRLERKPILMGHSMGGALAQWYLRKVADDLPGVVLLASWTARSTWADGMLAHMRRDPVGTTLVGLTLSTNPFIRSAKWSSSMLISDHAIMTADELHAKLVPESALVLNQHNPPMWSPKRSPKTPMLWVAGGADAVVSLKGARKSAEFYGADWICVEGAGHNLMIDKDYEQTAQTVSEWMARQAG